MILTNREEEELEQARKDGETAAKAAFRTFKRELEKAAMRRILDEQRRRRARRNPKRR